MRKRILTETTPCESCAAWPTCLLGQQSHMHRRQMAPFIREVSFAKRDLLLTEGVVSGTLKTIKLGTVMVTRRGPDGVARPAALLDAEFMDTLHTIMVRSFGRLADWLQVMRMPGIQRQRLATQAPGNDGT